MSAPEMTTAVGVTRHRFTVDDFTQMGDVGILRQDERVELVDGVVCDMAAIGERHAGCVNWLNHHLSRRVGNAALLGVQKPIVLDEYNEPQPDVAVLRPRADFYRSRHPHPADALLLIHIPHTTLTRATPTHAPYHPHNASHPP